MSIIKALQKRVALLAAPLIFGQLVISPLALAQNPGVPERLTNFQANKYTPRDIETMERSPSANPWLSIRPQSETVDWNYWRTKQALDASNKRKQGVAAFGAGGSQAITMASESSELMLSELGSSSSQANSVVIDGEFVLPAPTLIEAFAEDEGSILLATETGLQSGSAVRVESTIGDGPFGSGGTGSGDLDFYVVRNVRAGQTITVDMDTPSPFGPLDPYVEIYSSDGTFLAENDDGNPAESFDSFLSFTAPADDDYYISIAGYGTFFLLDPFDSSSGLGNIFGLPLDEGTYTATIGLEYLDKKTVYFLGRPGDVFGAAIDGIAADLSLRDPFTVERQGSSQDLRFIMPGNSPLPGGLVSINHAVDRAGVYSLEFSGSEAGAFSLNMVLSEAGLAGGVSGDVQIIFLDFDGATVDLSESILLDAPPGVFIAELSPLSAFIENWGLEANMEDFLIDYIVAVVDRNLRHDIALLGGNPRSEIQILNSRDHEDPFGLPNVSRVIVGGTIPELGVSTIGIAQSIDVGNFDTEETAFVLLDLLSDPNPLNPNSLNGYSLDPDVDKFELVGTAVGEIVSHEIGHYLGNWHTDQFNDRPNIMDQGGNLANTIVGVGPDGIFGTADDIDVRFGWDAYVPTEGLRGFEDTLTTIAWGATTPELAQIFGMLQD